MTGLHGDQRGFAAKTGAVCTIRDGKLQSIVGYSEQAAALEAAGLKPQPARRRGGG